jgi:hypothetical protein
MAMLDYDDQVKKYLEKHFRPGTGDRANLQFTTNQLLGFLWDAFPRNCISDFELDEIMIELGYERQQWVEEHYTEMGEGKDQVTKVSKSLVTGWCLVSDHDLREEEYATGSKK